MFRKVLNKLFTIEKEQNARESAIAIDDNNDDNDDDDDDEEEVILYRKKRKIRDYESTDSEDNEE
ncbi:hypothetical protein HPULCUR_005131 [Helicostylum pulchrum]|uniref:Uncharacterized protein n=1 Tax=Helicostylum pulchrum TaxID=562976 RepID=A0ABP9XY67_9FUNG